MVSAVEGTITKSWLFHYLTWHG